MDRAGRLKILRKLLNKIEELRPLNHTDPKFKEWHEEAKLQLREFYADHDYIIKFEQLQFQDLLFRQRPLYPSDKERYDEDLIKAEAILKMFIQWEEEEEKKDHERKSKEKSS